MGIVLLVWTVIAIAAVVVITVAITRHFLSGGTQTEDATAASLTQLHADVERLAARQERLTESLERLGRAQVDGAAATRTSLDATSRQMAGVAARMDQLRQDVAGQLTTSRDSLDRRLDAVGQTVSTQLEAIRTDNGAQLERMRATVDERLTKTLNDRLSTSFSQINTQLEAVDRGLGEMRGLASGVGDLKKVLGNVKTRGTLGEVQLGAILSEVLAPEQYSAQVVVKPGSSERVDFAVRLPVEEGEPIVLPLDAKFPGDAYVALRDATDAGDATAAASARARLERRIKDEAKSISEKYLSVPDTTNFAVMFLPFEGLYAEVVSMPGLVECLQRDYRVNVAGPSTMAALLNSLQLSYQSFSLQRRTDEVLRTLQAVKAELPKYQEALRRAKKQIDTAGSTVDSIITTRTNVMEKKLRSIALDEGGLSAMTDESTALGMADESWEGAE